MKAASLLSIALACFFTAAAAVEISTSGEFVLAIQSASDGETIQLQAGTYVGVCGIRLSKNLTIEGIGNVILDCGGEGAQFSIAGFGVRISLLNLAFARGYSIRDGGCLAVSHGAHVSLAGCSFSDCFAAQRGGALYAESVAVSMSQTTFTSCSAHQGGAICIRGHNSSAVMRDCKLLKNSAALDGGGVFVESGRLHIEGTTSFEENAAPQGGGIAARQDANSTEGFAISISGGANFQSNFADATNSGVMGSGGAIALFDFGSFVSSGAVTYNNNSAFGAVSQGGTFCILGAITFVLSGKAIVTRSFAFRGGAAFVNFGAYVEVRDGPVFSHNEVLTHGGCFFVMGAGSLLHAENHVRIEHNMALMAGAAIQAGDGPAFNFFHDVNLTHNFAGRYGAALQIYFNNKVETRGQVLIHDNYAGIDGAGLTIWMVAFVNLTAGTSFRRNIAARGGAGVKVGPECLLYADGVEFVDNSVASVEPSVGGGAILNQGGTMHLSNCYFASNFALVSAAISWGGGGDCTNSRFEHHRADVGAGVTHISDMVVTLDNNTFYNNSATVDGGCLVSAETSVLHLGSARFDSCSAGNNGAALLLRDAGDLHVTGHVIMQHGTAGGLGGAVHHQGKLLHVQEAATMTLTSNTARAGGGISSTNAITIGGQLSVVDNTAREGDGGGVQGLGVLAVTTVSESGWLEITRNQAARGNGGGIALLDNARLAFDLESGCPADCISLGDGTCDGTCMVPQCRWDAGDCDTAMVDAGEEATRACVRDALTDYMCPLWSLEDGGKVCYAGCISASCEWGFGSESCASTAAAIGQCPYTSALIYDSITANPDVRYVKDGGTAGGFGRCASNTCSPADASLGRDEPYCTTINDGGQVLEYPYAGAPDPVELGESWGPCAPPEKPRLPHIGFDYNPDELRAVIGMDIRSVLRRYSACGYQPISITANRAELAGGGVYKDRCEAFLERADRCFIGELDNKRLPTVVFDLADNEAGGPGGGFFVDCYQMSACLRAIEADAGIAMQGSATQPFIHFGDVSSSSAYGMQAAGPPEELLLASPTGNYTPGQALIDLSYSLVDSQRQTVHGSPAWPSPHLVEVSVCRVGGACTAADALQPPFLLRSHPTDEATSIMTVHETLAVCPIDDHRVEVHVRVAGDDSPRLHKSAVVGCEPCGSGQELVLHGEGASQVWSCRSCSPTGYVVTAEGGCQTCPLEGAACDGLSLTPTVDGAEWVADGATMRVAECPAGYIVVRDPDTPVLDTCVKCPPGTYSFRTARFPDTLAVTRASDAPQLCSECARGAECLGGDQVVALPGFWEDREARPRRRSAEEDEEDEVGGVALYQCSPGACEGDNSCSEGRYGAVCGLCEERWARSGLKCIYCGTEEDSALGQPRHIPSFIISVLLGGLCLYLLTWRPLLLESELALRAKLGCVRGGDDADDDSHAPESRLGVVRRYLSGIHWTSPAMIGAFKVAISFYQVASTFPFTFRIDWPEAFNLISSIGRLTGLDVSLLLPSAACLTREHDYTQGLIVFTAAFPCIVTLVLCLPFLLTRLLGILHHGGSRAHPKHDTVQRYCLRAVLLWFFLIYPTVSEHTLATFLCEDLGSGGHVLVMDKSVECPWGGSAPSGAFYLAIFLVLLYPIGIPAFFYYVVSAFFVPAMAEGKYSAALFGELVKLYRRETSTPITMQLAQHVGLVRQGSSDDDSLRASSDAKGLRRHDSDASAVPLRSFKRRVSQLFTHTFVQRELSGQAPEPAVYEKLQHVLEQFGCGSEDLVQVVAVLKRLSINPSLGSELNGFEQLAAKIAHNHFLFTGHEVIEALSMEQLQALFLFDWEGLNRRRSEREIRRVRARRQRVLSSMDMEQLRTWVMAKARELEKAQRIMVPTLNWNGASPEEERALGFVGFLFDDFRVERWWFFPLGEFCKLIMTSVIVFIPGHFWQQLAWGIFVQACVTLLYAVYQPMAEPWLNEFQLYALGLQIAILFFGLLVAFSDPTDAQVQDAFEPWAYLIVALKWSLPFYPLVLTLLAKVARVARAQLKRAVEGEADRGAEERDPSCLERVLFPTATNRRARQRTASLTSEASGVILGLQRSMSKEDMSMLDYGSASFSPSPSSPGHGASSPPTLEGRLFRRQPSTDLAETPLDPFSTPREPCQTARDAEPPAPTAGALPSDRRPELGHDVSDAGQGCPQVTRDEDSVHAPVDAISVELSVLPTPRP